MATAKVLEMNAVSNSGGESLPVGRFDDSCTIQSVSFTGTANASAAFQTSTRWISFVSDTACYYEIGSDPTATSSHMPLAADTLVSYEVRPGDKISFITQ